MFAKILAVSALLTNIQAKDFKHEVGIHVTSYSYLGGAPVAHYSAAPVAAHYAAAPVAVYHAAPTVVKPVAHYAAPFAAYQNTPAIVKIFAPVAHYAATVAAYNHAPTVVKTVAPDAHYAAPIVKAVHQDTHPQYSYQYGVQDAHTSDVKNQHKERDGDVVKRF